VRSRFFAVTCNYAQLPYINVKNTRFICRHRDAAAIDFWRGKHLPDGKLLPLSNGKSSSVYKALIADVYLDDVLAHYGEKYLKFISPAVSQNISPSNVISSISNNLSNLNKKVPSYLRFFHFKLINNALPTSRRCRHFLNFSIDQVEKCFFCGLDQDSVLHIFGSCSVVGNARSAFFSSLSLNTIVFSTAFPSSDFERKGDGNAMDIGRRSRLFPKLFSYLSSLNPPSLPSSSPSAHASPVSSVCFCSSLLCGVDSSLILPILCFNFAVWSFRVSAKAARCVRTLNWLINRIREFSTIIFNSTVIKPKPKAFRSSKEESSSLLVHNSLLADIGDDLIVCYTDGSASPNPGPCGAATSLFIKKQGIVIDAGIALGRGTNNIGELAALFICLNELIRLFQNLKFVRAIIFCDSKYGMNSLVSSRSPKSNPALITLLRAKYKFAANLFSISLHWVKGHSVYGGNIRVDRLAKIFAPLNAPQGFVSDSHVITKYYANCSFWPFGFPLSNIPLDCFTPPKNLLNPALWDCITIPSEISSDPLPDVSISSESTYVSRKRKSSASLVCSSFYDTSAESLDFKHGDLPALLLRLPVIRVLAIFLALIICAKGVLLLLSMFPQGKLRKLLLPLFVLFNLYFVFLPLFVLFNFYFRVVGPFLCT
jgi:ribonuclease HI